MSGDPTERFTSALVFNMYTRGEDRESLQMARQLLEQGANPSARDRFVTTGTLLHTACRQGKGRMIHLLLEFKADPATEYTQRSLNNPVQYTLVHGSNDILAVLLNAMDADTLKKALAHFNRNGHTALGCAVVKNNLEAVEQLLLAGASALPPKPGHLAAYTPLQNAAVTLHDNHILRTMLKYICRHRMGYGIHMCAESIWDALHHAAETGTASSVRVLHAALHDVQQHPGYGVRGRMMFGGATMRITPDAVVERMHTHRFAGCPHNASGWHWLEPLCIAAAAGSTDTVSALLDCKASACAHVLRSAIHEVCATPDAYTFGSGVLSLLLEADPDGARCRDLGPNTINILQNETRWSSRTPLHRAAKHGRINDVRLLLAVKADPSSADASGLTPLHLASRDDVVHQLLQSGAKTESLCSEGNTPLIHLLQDVRRDRSVTWMGPSRRNSLVLSLLNGRADPNARGGDGRSAWDLCIYHEGFKWMHTLRLLVEAGAGVPPAGPFHGLNTFTPVRCLATRLQSKQQSLQRLTVRCRILMLRAFDEAAQSTHPVSVSDDAPIGRNLLRFFGQEKGLCRFIGRNLLCFWSSTPGNVRTLDNIELTKTVCKMFQQNL